MVAIDPRACHIATTHQVPINVVAGAVDRAAITRGRGSSAVTTWPSVHALVYQLVRRWSGWALGACDRGGDWRWTRRPRALSTESTKARWGAERASARHARRALYGVRPAARFGAQSVAEVGERGEVAGGAVIAVALLSARELAAADLPRDVASMRG